MNEKINSFQERAKLLRCEVTDAIIGILKENNLSELQLSQNPDEVPWVVWFNDEMYGYDSRVKWYQSRATALQLRSMMKIVAVLQPLPVIIST